VFKRWPCWRPTRLRTKWPRWPVTKVAHNQSNLTRPNNSIIASKANTNIPTTTKKPQWGEKTSITINWVSNHHVWRVSNDEWISCHITYYSFSIASANNLMVFPTLIKFLEVHSPSPTNVSMFWKVPFPNQSKVQPFLKRRYHTTISNYKMAQKSLLKDFIFPTDLNGPQVLALCSTLCYRQVTWDFNIHRTMNLSLQWTVYIINKCDIWLVVPCPHNHVVRQDP